MKNNQYLMRIKWSRLTEAERKKIKSLFKQGKGKTNFFYNMFKNLSTLETIKDKE